MQGGNKMTQLLEMSVVRTNGKEIADFRIQAPIIIHGQKEGNPRDINHTDCVIRRYYFVRAERKRDAEDIERRLEAEVLEERRFNLLLLPYCLRENLIVDLEDFKIEEKAVEKIPLKRKRLFKRNDYGIHLLIEGTMRDLIRVEDYLAYIHGGGLKVEAVKRAEGRKLCDFTELGMKIEKVPIAAAYTFTTVYEMTYMEGIVLKNFREYLAKNYANGVKFTADECGEIRGIIHGDVEKIKEIAEFIRNGGMGLKVEDDVLQFRYNINGVQNDN